jgi:putative membrane protein
MTIQHFTDHAANERTFLAWVRTGIAVMAFGFLVDRFNIFLQVAATSLGGTPPSARVQVLGEIAGLGLILAGAVLIALAVWRFFRTRRAIDSPEPQSLTGMRLDLSLSIMLVALGIALAIYLATALH